MVAFPFQLICRENIVHGHCAYICETTTDTDPKVWGNHFPMQPQISGPPELFLITDTDLGFAGIIFLADTDFDFSGMNYVIISVRIVHTFHSFHTHTHTEYTTSTHIHTPHTRESRAHSTSAVVRPQRSERVRKFSHLQGESARIDIKSCPPPQFRMAEMAGGMFPLTQFVARVTVWGWRGERVAEAKHPGPRRFFERLGDPGVIRHSSTATVMCQW